jgi:hypothetical protein
VKPDLLIVDHGPTALLAAQGMGIRTVLLGNGFYVPPPVDPMPSMQPWLRVPETRLRASENKALETANAVLDGLGIEPLKSIPQLFDVKENFLCTFAELDPYRDGRDQAQYWGPINIGEWGAKPPWPSGEGKKVFAYLSKEAPDLEKILQTLSALACRSLVYVSRIAEAMVKKYSSSRLKFSSEPVDMDYVRSTCDGAVCHGGPGTTTALLLAGRPLLLLPLNLECVLLARSVEKQGSGLTIRPGQKGADYGKAIMRLLEEATFTVSAEAFAQRYADLDQKAQLEAMVERCEQIMAS